MRFKSLLARARASVCSLSILSAYALVFAGTANAQSPVTDSFNRTDGGLGANWKTNAIGSALQIAGNRIQTPAGEYAESLYTAIPPGTTQLSEVQHIGGLSTGVINLVVRAREYTLRGAGDGYIGQLNGFESRWKIIRVDNDAETIIASGSLAYANNDTFSFEANGSTLTLKKNGSMLGTATSATYASGDTGVGLYSAGGLQVDNWRGGQSADTQAPTAPAGLSATTVSASQSNLVWSASSDNVGVSAYLIERCQGNPCSDFTQIATSTATTYADT